MFVGSIKNWGHVAQRPAKAIGKALNYCQSSWQGAKSEFLQMDLETHKRKHYRLKGEYQTISDTLDYQKIAIPSTRTIKHKNTELNQKIAIFYGDIASLEIDAIVNAANENLQRGGGVCGVIFKAADTDAEHLQAECNTLKPCKEGGAKITGGYHLPAKYIIHAVGPRYKAGKDNEGLLAGAYKSSLDLLQANGLSSIAFPAISTGIFNFPNDLAAKVALLTTRKWLENNPQNNFSRIIFCLFDEVDKKAYAKEFAIYFPF